MSLKHSLLVMLSAAPATGYELSQQFKGGIGFFWNASHQQVYQQLAQMAKDGWVQYETQSQTDKPDRKIYAITNKGREALSRWLSTPVAPSKSKDALLIKLFAGETLVSVAVLQEELRRHRAIHQKNLDKLLVIEQEYRSKSAAEQRALQLPYLTLRRGITGETAWIAWADEALAALSEQKNESP
ncbi:PadR family transcriptional regulator [Simiduia agarivorans]|nr:PadR family transcriptional regulator [Simiduia agarivorans]